MAFVLENAFSILKLQWNWQQLSAFPHHFFRGHHLDRFTCAPDHSFYFNLYWQRSGVRIQSVIGFSDIFWNSRCEAFWFLPDSIWYQKCPNNIYFPFHLWCCDRRAWVRVFNFFDYFDRPTYRFLGFHKCEGWKLCRLSSLAFQKRFQ